MSAVFLQTENVYFRNKSVQQAFISKLLNKSWEPPASHAPDICKVPGRDWNEEKITFMAHCLLMPCLWGQTEDPSKPSPMAAHARESLGHQPEPWQEAEP